MISLNEPRKFQCNFRLDAGVVVKFSGEYLAILHTTRNPMRAVYRNASHYAPRVMRRKVPDAVLAANSTNYGLLLIAKNTHAEGLFNSRRDIFVEVKYQHGAPANRNAHKANETSATGRRTNARRPRIERCREDLAQDLSLAPLQRFADSSRASGRHRHATPSGERASHTSNQPTRI